jgi:hypothetical protein
MAEGFLPSLRVNVPVRVGVVVATPFKHQGGWQTVHGVTAAQLRAGSLLPGHPGFPSTDEESVVSSPIGPPVPTESLQPRPSPILASCKLFLLFTVLGGRLKL